MSLWDNNEIQFARLLWEIEAISGDQIDWHAIADLMDLSQEEVDQIMDRANLVLHNLKGEYK